MIAKQIIAYWRDSLTDAELDVIELNKENHYLVSQDSVQNGRISPHATRSLFANSKPEFFTPNQDDTEGLILPVVIAPFVAQKRYGKQQTVCPLLIPAELHEDGSLLPIIGWQRPWVPRTLLEPTASNLVLGSIDALDSFLNSHSFLIPDGEHHNAWGEVLELGLDLLENISNGQFETFFNQAGYQIGAKSAVINVANIKGISRNILPVYAQLLGSKNFPPLLKYMLQHEPIATKPFLDQSAWLEPSQKHTGSFSNKFSISPTQREALHHLLAMPQHQVLAVSGPPGTGKTTLLHSVIASLWVNAAVAGEQPPVIVATSTNNQAVTNIIDSLSSSDEIKRWIPVSSFGLYLVNGKTKQEEAEKQGILVTNKFDEGLPMKVESQPFVEKATVEYLAECANYFGQSFSAVSQAVGALHNRLLEQANLQHLALQKAFRFWEAEQTLLVNQKLGKTQQPILEDKLTAAEERLNNLQETLALHRLSRQTWHQHLQAQPFYYQLLRFLPWAKRKIKLHHQMFLNEHLPDIPIEPTTKEIEAHFGKMYKQIIASLDEAKTAIKNGQAELELFKERIAQTEKLYYIAEQEWQEFISQLDSQINSHHLFVFEHGNGSANMANLFNWLDIHIRHNMFVLATHYWEGRWLLEVTELIANDKKQSRNRQGQTRKWQRYAMLTPCFVTTMHTGPSFFDYYDRKSAYLYDFIDLLIVDEAGQVTPEVSGAMLALAKNALVVGDLKQIEPVWKIPVPVDAGNLQRHKLAKNEDEIAHWHERGITASCGSLMAMAEAVSPYQRTAKAGDTGERGLLLTEHRRCVPEIIQYCNRLAYNGRLRPLRPALTNHPWPHMGYVHVKGRSALTGASKQNEREAQAIVNWLQEQQNALKAHYGADLDNIIGIVTPFTAQANLLRSLLAEKQLTISKVGTVHTLQGGERPVVLFSSVYTTHDHPSYFFDRGPNMLNVAVSRAKDSFIVFGDMEIFNAQLDTPSGILAAYLLDGVGTEITDVAIPPRPDLESTTHRLGSLDKHVRTLKRAFTRAIKSLVIVSPFLRWNAVEADDICQQVSQAVARGVLVHIYIDRDFNENLSMPSAKQAAVALHQSGANIFVCRNIHSKLLCIDEDVFVEGSFNWLSAMRQPSIYTRYETSMIYTGEQVAFFISETVADIQQRVIEEFTG